MLVVSELLLVKPNKIIQHSISRIPYYLNTQTALLLIATYVFFHLEYLGKDTIKQSKKKLLK